MPRIIITVECEDDSDADWLVARCVGSVEDQVDLAREENRLDGNVEVHSERDFG